uniref:Trans-2,3-enoyl-CoA reductase-like n=1 Tax=Gorilla gorilla gorilla TaxID=9595 RepID=A0A2I2YF12_GORGO
MDLNLSLLAREATPGLLPGLNGLPRPTPPKVAKKPKKAVLFFEVEILDAKTREKLCFLDKVEPHATIAEIKNLFTKTHPQWYPARQSLRLDPKAARGHHGHTVLPGPGGPDQLAKGKPQKCVT